MLALPLRSIVTCWKSPSSRPPLQLMPLVQITPFLIGVGSAFTGVEKVEPPLRDSVSCSYQRADFDTLSGVPTALVWYSETAIFEPFAATQGTTDVPALISVFGADQLKPQFFELAKRMRL